MVELLLDLDGVVVVEGGDLFVLSFDKIFMNLAAPVTTGSAATTRGDVTPTGSWW